MAGEIKLFADQVKQHCKPKHGLLNLFTSSSRNIFPGTKIEFHKTKNKRLVAKAKERGANATKNGSQNFSIAEYTPAIYKEAMNYNIDNYQHIVAGQTEYDLIEKKLIIMDQTAEDVALLQDKVHRSMLLQAAYIFQTGKIPFKTASMGEGNVPDIDFETPSELLAALANSGAGSYYWDNASATPVENLEDRIELIETTGCTRVSKLIFGKDALNAFLANSAVQAELDNRRIDRGAFTFNEEDSEGMSLVGVYSLNNRNVEFWSFSDYYLDPADDTTQKTYIDSNKVVFIGDGDYQVFYAGVDTIKDVRPLDFLGTNRVTQIGMREASAMYVDTYVGNENNNVWLRLQMAPLLVPKTNDTFGCMQVLA